MREYDSEIYSIPVPTSGEIDFDRLTEIIKFNIISMGKELKADSFQVHIKFDPSPAELKVRVTAKTKE